MRFFGVYVKTHIPFSFGEDRDEAIKVSFDMHPFVVVLLLLCLFISFPSFSQQNKIFTDTIFISVNKGDFHDLERNRMQVMEAKIKATKLTIVPCVVKYKGVTTPAKIRLKGDRLLHFEEGNLSYRIELTGNSFIMGMQKFSLHRPRSRNYVYENLFHYALEREGILNLKHINVRLYFNSKDCGIYTIEQFMEKHLIESSRKREGPILHFSEDLSATNIDSMQVEIFGKEPKDVNGRSVYFYQQQMLEQFKQGKKKPSDIFDIKKLGDFFALTDVLGFQHASVAKSVRYYFNPLTAKLEPIGFDGHYHKEKRILITAEMGNNPNADWYYELYNKWFRLFFSNPETFDINFFSNYMQSLKRMVDKEYLNKLFKELNPAIDKEIKILKTFSSPLLADHVFWFGPDTFIYSTETIYKRQDTIRTLIAPRSRIAAMLLDNRKGNLRIGIRNTERLPIELYSISFSGKKYPVAPVVLLPAINWEEDSTYSILEVSIPNYNADGELKIEYSVVGLNEPVTDIVQKGIGLKYPVSDLLVAIERTNEPELLRNIKDFPFLSYDSKNKVVEFKPGYCVVDKPLSIPSGFTVMAKSGVEIDIKKNAYMIFHSPVDFKGSDKKFIKIYSSDTTGRGMLVLSEGRQNKLNYVEFSNLNTITTDLQKLTGAVTFYESPVHIYNCSFLNSYAEDALNIVRSDFELAWSLFDKTFSDAFDGDFVNGIIQDCTFSNLGNDAIDGSGSVIDVQRVHILNAGDKGISSGEASTITVKNCSVKKGKVGFASKDLSQLNIQNCVVDTCVYGFAAYQKKSQFGPSSIIATNTYLKNVKSNYLVEEGSSIMHNATKTEPNTKDAVLILYDDL